MKNNITYHAVSNLAHGYLSEIDKLKITKGNSYDDRLFVVIRYFNLFLHKDNLIPRSFQLGNYFKTYFIPDTLLNDKEFHSIYLSKLIKLNAI